MSIDIKFRGKRFNNGKWAYGYYIFEDGEHAIMTQANTKRVLIYNQVIFETVGQYTGIKDKNGKGKDVYKDDIVSCEEFDDEGKYREWGIIQWHDNGWKWNYRGEGKEWWELDELENIKIIGNTHEKEVHKCLQ